MEQQNSAKGLGEEFSDETIAALKELAEVLLAIHNRLISEGYKIVDGKYVPPTQDQD